MTTNKNKHGGARNGAGRKKGTKKTVTIRIEPHIAAEARRIFGSISNAVVSAVIGAS